MKGNSLLPCRIRRLLTEVALLATVLLLSACGGGLSKDDTDESFAVNAGRDRSVAEQTDVSLSAQVSFPTGAVVYSWSSTPALTITHDDTSLATASLTTPAVTADTQYVITVSATDSAGQAANDSFTLTVTPENLPPTAIVTVDSWADLPVGTYPAGVSLTFDGRNSTDSDSTSSEEISAWTWLQTAGEDVLTGIETDQSTLVIDTPVSDAQQTLTFSLTVVDDEGAEDTTSHSITV